ncbi:MAG: DnaD domain protein [Clostridiales bacterium]|nr:DnaD domain protein [Clostridiales bacterium]
MAFVKLGSEYIKEGYTQVDNMFLLGYLPSCDALDVKIYLFGLAMANLADEGENQLEKMALSLQLSEERIIQSYRFWEKKGLVNISKTNPPSIKYLSVKHPMTPIVKFSTEKYASFVEEVERLFPKRILNSNEYNAFMELIESSKMEMNAMLLIMQYCSDLKGGAVSTPYILAVANAWIKQGLLTEKQVDEHIKELENNSEDIRLIFKALSVRRNATLEDRQMYLDWINGLNYKLDAILVAAKALKRRGGMERLDRYLNELYKAKAFTAQEVAAYAKEKEEINNLAIDINKNLGLFYGNTEVIVETYIIPWLNMGFEREALTKIAKFCLMRGVRNYDGMEQLVNIFYKKGLLSQDAIDRYIASQIAIDDKIRKIYDACNYFGVINGRDRKNYKTWLEWGFEEDVMLFVASQFNNNPFPMQSINRTLASLHARDIKALSDVEKELTSTKKSSKKPQDTFSQREYTDEELRSVLVDFEEWDK